MEQFIRAISPRKEFIIVVAVAFGYFIFGNILSVFHPAVGPAISDAGLQFLIVSELVILAVLSVFLQIRGWDRRKLGLAPNIKDTMIGFGLTALSYACYAVLWLVLSSMMPGLNSQAGNILTPGLGFITVLAVSLLNPIFEEVFV